MEVFFELPLIQRSDMLHRPCSDDVWLASATMCLSAEGYQGARGQCCCCCLLDVGMIAIYNSTYFVVFNGRVLRPEYVVRETYF